MYLLKTLDTIGSCQTPVFSLMYLNIGLCIKLQSCVIIMKEKTSLSHEVVLSDA